uniref:CAZy families GH36 protein n=1 Tax=uncultured Lactobacillus sp. TaxID=153152 RepID=A0A060CGN6_9LACO|nr:CAZy families GH36 protein [uncultured Lactobacillus sp.]
MQDLIEFDERRKVFHLHNGKISYLFSVEEGGILSHLYFGTKIVQYHGQLRYPRIDRGFSGNLPGTTTDRGFSRDTLPQEYSSNGVGDYRVPAMIIRHQDGSCADAFLFKNIKLKMASPN